MSNRRDGVLYVGVTTDLPKRSYQHRQGLVDGFTKRYRLKLLVYYEVFDDVRNGNTKREEHEALAASVEGQVDPRL